MGSGPGRIGQVPPLSTDFSDIGPRAGFAWNIMPSIVVRGGFGIFYEGLGNGGCGCEDGFGGGSYAQASDGFNPASTGIPEPTIPITHQQSRRRAATVNLPLRRSRFPAPITSTAAFT